MRYRTVKRAAGRISTVAIALCLIFGLMSLSGSLAAKREDSVGAAKDANEIGEGESAVREFLKSFGWEASDKPAVVKEIFIPKSFDAVYERYNSEIQIPQGYDLRDHAGLSATLYSYEVYNYPDEDGVSANVLVRDGVVIGGDICSSRLDGFMHGIKMHN